MKGKKWMMVWILLMLCPGWVYAQPVRPEPPARAEALRIQDLEMSPDPVREGQRIRFTLTLFNRTSHVGRANITIKDRDEVVAEARGFIIRPGNNRVDFPDTGYRFSRREHCFSVEVDIAGTRSALDFAREFCVQRISGGWTLSKAAIGPFVVEDLEMTPDPAKPRQEVRFRLRLKNNGIAVRGTLRILDRDETVSRIDSAWMEPGFNEYPFPFMGYSFQRSDPCFSIVVDVEGKTYPAESVKELCARPLGWTLR